MKLKLARNIDCLLLFFCCLLVAARCQIHESFPPTLRVTGPLPGPSIGYAGITTMMILTGLILLAGVVWAAVHIICDSFTWRRTKLVLPVFFIMLAGAIATSSASNKHTALIAGLTLLGQLVLTLLLIQLLDTPQKQKLMLCVIAATGVTFAYRCWEQYHWEIPETIRMFDEDPTATLANQQLEPGTYAAQQYIERLQSRDISGYFAISNTAASFFILSITATLGLLLGQGKKSPRTACWFIAGVALFIQMAGLLLTQSKGGIGAWIAGIFLLVLFWKWRKFFLKHLRLTFASTVVIILIGVFVIIAYGLAFNRLPTNSMWVRWQYWHATGKMIADHFFSGVGPGNFGIYYPRYMDGAAPEVVKDPHCLWLALWSQWGLLALVGFSWGCWRIARYLVQPSIAALIPDIGEKNRLDEKTISGFAGILSPLKWGLPLALGIIAIRLLVSDLTGLSGSQLNSVLLVSYILPGLIWFTTFILLMLSLRTAADQSFLEIQPFAIALIGCGLLAFLLHNSIDMAVFQPGAGTCFFALVATAVALRQHNRSTDTLKPTFQPVLRVLIPLILVSILLVMFAKIFLPCYREQNYLRQAEYYALQANQSLDTKKQSTITTSPAQNYYAQAKQQAEKATKLWLGNPAGHYFLGRLYLLQWYQKSQANKTLLQNSFTQYELAIRDDKDNYKYYQQLSGAYQAGARCYPKDREYLEKAREYAARALKRYPTKSELLIEYGKILQELNQPQAALHTFEKALEIEDAFLDQQQQMYPLRTDLIPRLRPELHRWTVDNIRKLKQTP